MERSLCGEQETPLSPMRGKPFGGLVYDNGFHLDGHNLSIGRPLIFQLDGQ